jgi:hypothetical protein
VLVNLPEKKVETHTIKLSPEEQKVYDKVYSTVLTHPDHSVGRVCIKVKKSDPDPHQSEESNPDPDQGEKSNPDPDQSEKSDPDLLQRDANSQY